VIDADGPFGATVAHGFLTLSLLVHLSKRPRIRLLRFLD
jgi:acyl dehydratase